MRLSFVYHPTTDLPTAERFYREQLGLEEAWRDGDDTIAFAIPDSRTTVMVSTTPQPAGPMYLVDDLAAWTADHANLPIAVPRADIPGGAVTGFTGPDGFVFYVFDQPDA